ncbi:hypothetical protein ACFV0O_33130, partial [Kitasatospora sp. NPDC059577]
FFVFVLGAPGGGGPPPPPPPRGGAPPPRAGPPPPPPPAGSRTLAACHEGLFVTHPGGLGYLPFQDLPASADAAKGWRTIGPAPGLASLSATVGRLFALTDDGRILSRLPAAGPSPWHDHGPADGCTTLAAHAGTLLGVDPTARSGLRRRPITPPITPTPITPPGPRPRQAPR